MQRNSLCSAENYFLHTGRRKKWDGFTEHSPELRRHTSSKHLYNNSFQHTLSIILAPKAKNKITDRFLRAMKLLQPKTLRFERFRD